MQNILALSKQDSGLQEVGIFILLVIAAIFLNRNAYKKNLFAFSSEKIDHHFPSFKATAQIFLIYIALTFVLPSLLFGVFRNILFVTKFDIDSPYALVLIHLFSIGSCLVALYLFLKTIKAPFINNIWKKDKKKSIFSDLSMGVYGFVISYPVVLVAGIFFDFLIQILFNFVSYEQVAVKYLKNSQTQVAEMVVALFTIIVFAPFVEELLFRGFLQTYLRRYFKPHLSFALSSFLFAIFHFSFSQSIGNISVILTLFILGWYLGVIYERQGSLLSTICFHAVFNLTSAWRVLVETSGG